MAKKWSELFPKSGAKYTSCFHSHPPLPLPDSDLVIYGGSCIAPSVSDADVYIGFDSNMKKTSKIYPWVTGEEVPFYIVDMGVPKDVAQFVSLVDWTITRLEAGDKIHAGCIGGHGRTGLFFAALVSRFGEEDAVTYVRENYCKKAVESSVQSIFLESNFGVKPVAGTKEHKSAYKSSKNVGGFTYKPLKGPMEIWGDN